MFLDILDQGPEIPPLSVIIQSSSKPNHNSVGKISDIFRADLGPNFNIHKPTPFLSAIYDIPIVLCALHLLEHISPIYIENGNKIPPLGPVPEAPSAHPPPSTPTHLEHLQALPAASQSYRRLLRLYPRSPEPQNQEQAPANRVPAPRDLHKEGHRCLTQGRRGVDPVRREDDAPSSKGARYPAQE